MLELHKQKISSLFPRQQPCVQPCISSHTFNKMQLHCQTASPVLLPPAHHHPPSPFLLLHLPSLSVSCCIPSSKRRAPRHHFTPGHLPFPSLIFFLILHLFVLHLTKSSTVMENTMSGRDQKKSNFLMNRESASSYLSRTCLESCAKLCIDIELKNATYLMV